jgi:hypothetical protein
MLTQLDNQCLSICPPRYYNNNSKCKPCKVDDCEVCNENKCTVCKEDGYVFQVDKCILGYPSSFALLDNDLS